jgi:hypothetical protein
MLLGNDPLDKFEKSFLYFDAGEEFKEELYNYVILGLRPGSFHWALYANDFVSACNRSHPANSWQYIQETGKWLYHEAPSECWGSYEKVDKWLALPNDERRAICEAKGLIATSWEILKAPGVA